MNKLFFALAFSAISCMPAYAFAAKDSGIVANGLSAYKEGGAKSAIEAWIKGSGIEGSKEALAQANMLIQISDYYGKYLDYELVKKNPISKTTSVSLVVINYEKGSVFAKFFTYIKPDGKEVVLTFNFNTNADAIFPSTTIYDQ